MIAVAITRWGGPPADEAEALAGALNEGVYEVKLRIARPLPVVLARVAEPERARELLALARGRGHGAVACELSYVPSSDAMHTPKSYAFEAESFVGIDAGGSAHRTVYLDMLALVRARTTDVDQVVSTTRSNRFSLGRAVMSGGLVMTKSKATRTQVTSEDSEQLLYVIRRDGREPMLLRERRLRHDGLGGRIRPTSAENFSEVVSLLRERAPEALYDERMVTQRRSAEVVHMSASSTDGKTAMSNSRENDLCAHLLAVAYRSGQL